MFCNGGLQKTSRNASFGEPALQKTSRFATNLRARARAQPVQVAAQSQPALQQKRSRKPPQAAEHTKGPAGHSSKLCEIRCFADAVCMQGASTGGCGLHGGNIAKRGVWQMWLAGRCAQRGVLYTACQKILRNAMLADRWLAQT